MQGVQFDGMAVTEQVLGGARRMMRFGLDPRIGEVVLAAVPQDADVPAFSATFARAGAEWEERAAGALAQGNAVSARLWYRQAFYLYRVAFFAYTTHADKKYEAYDAAVRCFAAATLNVSPRPEPVTVQALGREFDGILVCPPNGDAYPVCIVVYGSDGMKEEHYWQSALPLVERGIAALICDGPGQGGALRHGAAAIADYETFIRPCVDLLRSDRRFLPHAIGIMGSSAGGYYAPRAFANEERLRVLMVNSALHTALEGSWANYPAARPQLRYNANVGTDDEAFAYYQPFTLTGQTNVDPQRPARIYHGSADRRIPTSQAHKLAAFLGERAEVVIWEGGSHNLGNVAVEAHPQMWDWMAGQLHRIARGA